MLLCSRLATAILLAGGSFASPLPEHELGATNDDSLVVDLGYARYRGTYDSQFDQNEFKGIRFAAPPKRWQLPEPPQSQGEDVVDAVNYPPRCPIIIFAPGPEVVDFERDIHGSEDCLFLNVFAPPNAQELPVLFAIHGGGYGTGSAFGLDYSYMRQDAPKKGFVTVAIQYRLGAFGFLSSADLVKDGRGVANAGLHDMRFALQWVQKHIEQFGGDPSQITIMGESAGGGAVMLLAMANGGEEGTSLFKRAIASSPYLPTQYNFDDPLPTEYYRQFAERAGCLDPHIHPRDATAADDVDSGVFECLQNADTLVLQNASAYTSLGARFGQWAFIPVTDGNLIQEPPSKALKPGKKLNGERLLVGTNSNEGTMFVPDNITTEATFMDWVSFNYPDLTQTNLSAVLDKYMITPAPDYWAHWPHYQTDGLTWPYATAMSEFAAGWQQAAYNLYAETTFICPAEWMWDAYRTTQKSSRRSDSSNYNKAWRYQLSTFKAEHAADLGALQSDPKTNGTVMNEGFRKAFQRIYSNFIVSGDPTLSDTDIKQFASLPEHVSGVSNLLDGAHKDEWEQSQEVPSGLRMLNINATMIKGSSEGVDLSERYRAVFDVVDGKLWESKRRERCDLWRNLGDFVKM